MKSFDDVITKRIQTSSLTLGDVRVENQNPSYSAEILFRGKIRLLIMEMS